MILLTQRSLYAATGSASREDHILLQPPNKGAALRERYERNSQVTVSKSAFDLALSTSGCPTESLRLMLIVWTSRLASAMWYNLGKALMLGALARGTTRCYLFIAWSLQSLCKLVAAMPLFTHAGLLQSDRTRAGGFWRVWERWLWEVLGWCNTHGERRVSICGKRS